MRPVGQSGLAAPARRRTPPRRAGRRVLGHARSRREHAGMEGVARGRPSRRRTGRSRWSRQQPHPTAPCRGGRARCGKSLTGRTGTDCRPTRLRREAGIADVGRRKAERRGDRLGSGARRRPPRAAWRGRNGRIRGRPGSFRRGSARARSPAPGRSRHPAIRRARQEHRGTDRRVAGERELARRREDADAGPVAGLVRRQHEHGLGQIELASDRLHGGGVEPGGLQHDGERIAGEAAIGEHIEGGEASPHGTGPDRWAPQHSVFAAVHGPKTPQPGTGQGLRRWRERIARISAGSESSLLYACGLASGPVTRKLSGLPPRCQMSKACT